MSRRLIGFALASCTGISEGESTPGPTLQFAVLAEWKGGRETPGHAGQSVAWWDDGSDPPMLAIGSPGKSGWEDNGGCRVYVVNPATTPSRGLDWSDNALYPLRNPDLLGNSQYGFVVVAPGDLDGDGVPDLAVLDRADRAYVVPGPAPGARRHLALLELGSNDVGAAACGDVTGDGFSDLCLGSGVVRGPVTAVPDGLSVPERTTWPGIDPAMVRVGGSDMDGDGQRELIVWKTSSGVLFRVAAPPVGDVDLLTADTVWMHGISALEGSMLTGVDVDGDGAEEVVLGCSVAGAHEVVVVSGTTGQTLPCDDDSPLVSGAGAMAAGDFDGDGVLDLAVGGGGNSGGAIPSDEVWIVLGPLSTGKLVREAADGVLSSVDPDSETFGWSLAATDIDGDGRAELAVGEPEGGDTDGYGATGLVTLFTLVP